MIGNEHRVGTDGAHHHRLQGDRSPPRRDYHPVAGANAVLGRQAWMEFQFRFGVLIDQRADAACLRAR